jgi:hypothetical protein
MAASSAAAANEPKLRVGRSSCSWVPARSSAEVVARRQTVLMVIESATGAVE